MCWSGGRGGGGGGQEGSDEIRFDIKRFISNWWDQPSPRTSGSCARYPSAIESKNMTGQDHGARRSMGGGTDEEAESVY